jgi:hypothetical protein
MSLFDTPFYYFAFAEDFSPTIIHHLTTSIFPSRIKVSSVIFDLPHPPLRVSMPSIYTSIEIAAPPSAVRAAFLDFENLPSWTTFIKLIEPYDPSNLHPKDPASLLPGTKLHIIMPSLEMYPTILVNSPSELKWQGKLWGLPGIFTGEHAFRFEESKLNPGGTTFVHAEEFWGILPRLLLGDGSKTWNDVKASYEKFNGEIKVRCEEGQTPVTAKL